MYRRNLLIFLILFGSCDRRVDHLTYYKKYNHTRQDLLRTHGYYYSYVVDSLGRRYKDYKRIFILFNNGTFFGEPNTVWSEANCHPDSLRKKVAERQTYGGWGVYKIDGQNIYLRGSLPFHGGEPYLIKGRILNDTTFVLDWLKYDRTKPLTEDSIDAKPYDGTYKYFHLIYKPDSTNWMLTNEDLNQ